jgi:hypothetical protein
LNQRRVQVEVYSRQNASEDWTKQTYSNLHSEIHFASIGIKVGLADIYKRVRFSENLLEIEREE